MLFLVVAVSMRPNGTGQNRVFVLGIHFNKCLERLWFTNINLKENFLMPEGGNVNQSFSITYRTIDKEKNVFNRKVNIDKEKYKNQVEEKN